VKLIVAIALILLLAVPTVACSEAGAWQDAIARAVARTDAAQSYRFAANSTTQDFDGCTRQSSFAAEYSEGDSHSRWAHTRDCQNNSPDDATTASRSSLIFTGWSQSWHEITVVENTTFVRSSNRPKWRECAVTTGSRPPIASEPRGLSAPPVPPPSLPPILAHTPGPIPPLTPPPIPPLFSPPPTPASSAPTPALPRVRVSGSPTMTVEPSRTNAPALTPASENCSIARASSPDSLDWLINVERLPDEAVDGVPCSHYRGSVDQNSYVDMLIETYKREGGNISDLDPSFFEYLNLMRRQEINVDLWIDGEDYIRRVREDTRFPARDSDTGEETWGTGASTTRYFDFNEPIVIEPPDLTTQ